jgi:NADH:ubiquinone oxidoreductase subunit C
MTQTENIHELDIPKLIGASFKADNLPIHTGTMSAVQAPPTKLHDILKVILEADKKSALTTITCLDLGENLGVYYHMRLTKGYFTVKTEVPKTDPKIQTVTDLLPGANFAELEGTDLLGVTYEGNPLSGHFMLSENWPIGVYPLRKDVNMAEVKLVPSPPQEETRTRTFTNSTIGPQHPALIEPEKLSVTVEGEIVKNVEPRLGYVHRGIDKATESRTYLRDIYLWSVSVALQPLHARVFVVLHWNKILGVDIPPSRLYIFELSRW